jgi:hypothetical protein
MSNPITTSRHPTPNSNTLECDYKAKIAAMIPATPANEVPTCMLLAAPVVALAVPEALADPEPEAAVPVALPVPAVPVAVAAEPLADPGAPVGWAEKKWEVMQP